APVGRYSHSAIWTGTEMIVWGGDDVNFDAVNSGGHYNPQTDAWVATETNNAPPASYEHTVVWTGNAMIVWGGRTGLGSTDKINSGGVYDVSNKTWFSISSINSPSARTGHPAIWTGTEMIIWGGNSVNNSDGGRYDLDTNQWAPINSTTN